MPSLPELFTRREELPDGSHFDHIDKTAKPKEPEIPTSAKALFDRMAKLAPDPKPPEPKPKDWIWADVPTEIRERLSQWRDMFVEAIPGATPVEHLHITLFHQILNLENDLKTIINTTADTVPCQATLGTIKAFRTTEGIAVAIEVISSQLEELRHALDQRIEHVLSIHGIYQPHITLAYIPPCEGIAVEGLRLYQIAGRHFLIESINVGTEQSHQSCAMLGAKLEWISRFGPTRPDSRTEKSIGMNTTTMEDGGVLVRPEVSQKPATFETTSTIDPDDEWDDFEEDEDDDGWMLRSMEITDSLDENF